MAGRRRAEAGSGLASAAGWDRSAREYDRFERRWHHYSRVAEGMVRRLGIGRDSRVLELASGTGACTLLLSARCPAGEVVCVERSAEMVRAARANVRSAGRTNVSFVRGDVGRLTELLDGRAGFDFAVCNSAFWHFPEPEGVMRAVRGALRPGGVFAFNVPSRYGPRERLAFRKVVEEVLSRNGIDPSRFWSAGRMGRDYPALLKAAGFALVEEGGYHVTMPKGAAEEWRRIPVFAGPWAPLAGLPPRVAEEVRRELRKARLERGPGQRRAWRFVVGRSG